MPVTIPRNEEMAERARQLYVPGIVSYRQVAEILGCSYTSVARYVNPQYAERERRISLEAKRRRTGVCEKCGGETRYSGSRGNNGPARTCKKCNDFPPQTHCKNGHPLIPENRVRVGGSGGEMCRLCRNAWQREYARRKRRERGTPEYGEYRRPKEKALLAIMESEGAAQS